MQIKTRTWMNASLVTSLWKHKNIVWQLTKRDIQNRYKGSKLGLAWSVLNPLIMLCIYTYVFSQVFQVKWTNASIAETNSTDILDFGLNLFAGLIVFNMVAESLQRSPSLIVRNQNFVKKIIFPLETLSVVNVLNSLFHACTSIMIIMIFKFVVNGTLISLVWVLPLVWLPLIFLIIACSMILSIVGVLLKDTVQLVTVFTSVLMYLSPIFYPTSAVPVNFRWITHLNPLTGIIESTRQALILNELPNLSQSCVYAVLSLLICDIVYRAMNRIKPYLSDWL